MSHTYDTKRHANTTSVPGPSMEALRSGAAAPSQAQLGRSVTMPDAVRSKMEQSFGTDLSSIRLYESQAVADAGAHAMSQGTRIAFAPGMLDFTSQSGQQLLGHELSHVVSQSKGEVRGSGFLQNASLEARADREGAMAAAGKPVFAGAVSAAVSDMSAAADSGPVQAAGKPDEQARTANDDQESLAANLGRYLSYNDKANDEGPGFHVSRYLKAADEARNAHKALDKTQEGTLSHWFAQHKANRLDSKANRRRIRAQKHDPMNLAHFSMMHGY